MRTCWMKRSRHALVDQPSTSATATASRCSSVARRTHRYLPAATPAAPDSAVAGVVAVLGWVTAFAVVRARLSFYTPDRRASSNLESTESDREFAAVCECRSVLLRRRELLPADRVAAHVQDRKSTRLNSSHSQISYAVFCLKKKNIFRHRVVRH